MIGACDVKSAAVSSRQSSGFLVGRGLSLPHSEHLRCIVWIVGTWCCDTTWKSTILPMYWACGTHCLLSVLQHNGYMHSLIEGLRWLDERRLDVRDTLSQPSTRCRGLATTKNRHDKITVACGSSGGEWRLNVWWKLPQQLRRSQRRREGFWCSLPVYLRVGSWMPFLKLLL